MSIRWLTAVILTSFGAAVAARTEINLSDSQRQWLRSHGDIVVGTTAQGRGAYESWQHGELKGLSVDYLDMVTGMLGLRYRVQSYPTWHDLYLATCTGKVDMVMTQTTPAAAAQQTCLTYTRPYFKAMPVVVSRRGSGVLDSVDLHGLRLTMAHQSSLVEALSERFKDTSIETFDDATQALEEVREGRADAFIGNAQAARAQLETTAFRQLHIIGSLNTASRNYAFGVAAGREALRDALDAALHAMSNDQIVAASHHGLAESEATTKPQIPLSTDELRQLAQLPTLRVGFPMREFPYAFYDHYGQPSGIAADFLEMIAQGLAIRLDFVPIETTQVGLVELKQGHLDLVAVSQDHPQDPFVLTTQAYAEAPLVIVTGTSDSVTELRDLAGAMVALDAGASPGIQEKLARHHITTLTVANAAEGLNHVREGEIRAYIGDLFLLDPLIQRSYVGAVKIAAPVGARQGISISLSAKHAALAPLINRILSSLPSGREQRVVSTWLAPQYSYGIPESVFWQEILPAMLFVALASVGFAAGYWRLRQEVRRRTESEARLEVAKELAQSQAQARSTFLAVMSHEIRTPLSGVIGMLELLARTPMDSDKREMVGAVDESARALLQILDSVLDYTKVDADQLELEQLPVDLRSLLDNVMLLMGEPARRRNIRVFHHVAAEVAPTLIGDPVRLRQIMANLAGNAVKFTHKGEIRASLFVVSSTPDRQRVALEIVDSGIGIAPEALHNLMTPFKQADRTTARKYGGTGLGLAVSQRLANLMGGSIVLSSMPGAGTVARFEFDLPIGDAPVSAPPCQQEPDFLLSPPAQAPNIAAASTRARAAAPPLILIVEDHRINRQMLTSQLEALGCHGDSAADGATALELLTERKYDLLLTDWQLPPWDGVGLASRWRAIERQRGHEQKMPIMLLSAALHPERDAWKAAGIDAYLRKPVRLETLQAALRRLLPAWNAPTLDATPFRISQDEQGIDLEALEAVLGSPDAVRKVLSESSILLRQELQNLKGRLASILQTHWTKDLHRMLGAISTIGHWQVLTEGEKLEHAVATGQAVERLPDILPLLQGLDKAIAEAEWHARQGQ